MGDFNRGRGPRERRFDNRRSFGSRSGGRRDEGQRHMFHAICDNCGKDCEVPFRPSGEKPVYCSDCFEKKGGRDSQERNPRDEGRRSFDRPQFNDRNRQPSTSSNQYKQDFEALNAKLDKILRLLTPVETPKSIEEEVVIQEKIEKPEKKKAIKKVTSKKV